jgi:hypothetical protein
MVSPSKPILYYVTYLGPSCLILTVNCIVFILVSKVLFQRHGRGHAVGKVGINTESPTVTVAQVRQVIEFVSVIVISTAVHKCCHNVPSLFVIYISPVQHS